MGSDEYNVSKLYFPNREESWYRRLQINDHASISFLPSLERSFHQVDSKLPQHPLFAATSIPYRTGSGLKKDRNYSS